MQRQERDVGEACHFTDGNLILIDTAGFPEILKEQCSVVLWFCPDTVATSVWFDLLC